MGLIFEPRPEDGIEERLERLLDLDIPYFMVERKTMNSDSTKEIIEVVDQIKADTRDNIPYNTSGPEWVFGGKYGGREKVIAKYPFEKGRAFYDHLKNLVDNKYISVPDYLEIHLLDLGKFKPESLEGSEYCFVFPGYKKESNSNGN